MKKQRIVRILTSFLLLITVFSDIAVCGFDVYAESNDPFSYYDRQRSSILEGKTVTGPSFSPSKGGERYIVAFNKGTDKRVVYDSVKNYDFSLPAYSSELVFVISIPDIDSFKKSNSSIIRYAIPDEVVGECTEFHSEYTENVLIGANEELTSGGEGVVVAVLDSGIERGGEAFESSVILEGFDCILGKVGVDTDEEGHGSRVAAIIVSSDTGIARGASLLPVKITNDAHRILTSDLIEGLYYAADYGADVINMSFGGYTENIAEKEAVSYAASKGCILVASAGNEGNDPELAGRMSYPASFDKVISVASVNSSGEASAFSQYNKMVDIASPGEMLHLYGKDENSPYTEISGTSYATAYVSAVASLAVSSSPRHLGHDGFEKLLEYSSVVTKNERTGYGVINIPRIMENLDKPVVNGVSNGSIYFEAVRAYFENASALLDGEEYESGDSVFSQGSHTLVVTDEYGSITIRFDVDTVPLTYNIENGSGWVAITFENGEATLDGEKYISGTRITGHGSHKFVLTGVYGNSVSETVFISYDLPSVYGVEDGEVYDRGIYITATGGGHTYLNGKEFSGGIFVGAKGDYVLRITDDSSTVEKEIHFSLSRNPEDAISDSPFSRITHSGKDGIIVFWENGEKTFSVCSDEDISSQTSVKTQSGIVTVGSYNGEICVVTSDGWYFYDPASPTSPVRYGKPEDGKTIVSASFSEGKLVYVDSDGEAVFTDGEVVSAYHIGGMNTTVEYGNGMFYLYSAMVPSAVYVYDGEWTSKLLSNYPMMFRIKAGNGLVCVGSTVYDSGLENILCELPETSRILWCGDGVIITSDKLFYSDGRTAGVYPQEISYVCRNGERTYFVYSDGRYSYTDDAENFGSFISEDTLTGKIQNVKLYEYIIPIVSGKKIKDACYDKSGGLISVICENDNKLYYINPENGENTGRVILRYTPSSLRETENGAAVVFMNSASVYLAGKDEYITFPSRVSDVCVSDGRIFAVCGGKLCEYVSEGNVNYLFENMNCDSLAGANGYLFVSSDRNLYKISVSDLLIEGTEELFFRGKLALTEDFVIAGNSVYEIESFTLKSELEGRLLAVKGCSAVTDSGLYSVSDSVKMSDYRSEGIAVITDSFDTFFFGSDSITVIRSEGDMCTDPVIEGVEDSGTYASEVVISVSKGTVYLDGFKTASPMTVSGNGQHVLRVVLPWGITKQILFVITSQPEAVYVTESVGVSAGRSVRLNPKVTPEISDVVFTYSVVSGDSARVNSKGYVTAVSEGVTVIRVGVEGTELEAFVTVTVSDTAINSGNEDYIIDRENDIIYGIAAMTDVSEFLGFFGDGESTHVLTLSDSSPVTEGIVRTGMILSKYNSHGRLTDSLTVAVRGDLDGDGLVTLNDSGMLYDILRTGKYMSVSVKYASDVNLNGNVTMSDFKEMRALVTYDGEAEKSDGYAHITCPAFVYRGSTFYVTFRNDGIAGCSGVSGLIEYDDTSLELVKTEYYYGEIYTENSGGCVKYSAYGIGKPEENTRLFRMYFYVKPTAEEGTISLGLTDTNIRHGRIYTLDDRYVTTEIKAVSKDYLAVSSLNSDLEFDENITEYEVIIPNTDNRMILDIDCPSHHYVYYSDTEVPEDGTVRTVLEYVTPTKVVDYVFNIRRGTVHIPESDPSLYSVEVSGGILKTPFSPDITEYTVIADGEVSYTVIPVGSRTQVEYSYSDDGSVFTVKCTSEDGNVRIYTFTEEEPPPEVSDEPVSEESEESSSEESEEEPSEETEISVISYEESKEFKETDGKTALFVIIPIVLIGISASVVVYVRRKSKNKSK